MTDEVEERWRAWRMGGQRYNSEETTWRSLPAGGLIGVVVHGNDYRRLLTGADWYYVEDGRIKAVGRREDDEPGPPDRGNPNAGPPAEKPDGIDDELIKRGAPVPDHVLERFDVDYIESRPFP